MSRYVVWLLMGLLSNEQYDDDDDDDEEQFEELLMTGTGRRA